MRNTTIKQLRAIAETAKFGSVTQAAKSLNVTPPAISLQLKLLEEAAAIPLLFKDEGGFRPTAAGALMVEAAKRIDAILKECGEAIAAQRDGTLGTVHVGAVSTAKYFVPRALAAFRHAHPNVEIKLSVGNREQTIASLENHELDLAITGRPPRHFEVEQEEIGPHPHLIIAPPDHPWAGRTDVAPEDLANETFLLRELGSGTRGLTDQFFARLGKIPKIGMEITSNETIKQAVMAGLGIAVISAHTVSVELRERRLAVIGSEGLPILRAWFVVRRKSRLMLPAASNLWDFLASEAKGYLPDLHF